MSLQQVPGTSCVCTVYVQGRNQTFAPPPGGGGGPPLYGDVPLDKVWFFTPPVLNRV